MKIRDIITERTTDIVYHGTNAKSACSILQQKRFKLNTGLNNLSTDNPETKLRDIKRPFYLSVARSRQSKFFIKDLNKEDFNVILIMNGNWLSQKYKIDPVNYGHYNKNNEFKYDEMEDRISHHKPYINFEGQDNKIIKEIWITLPEEQYTGLFKEYAKCIKYLLNYAEESNINIKIYDNIDSMAKNKKDIPTKIIMRKLEKLGEIEDEDAIVTNSIAVETLDMIMQLTNMKKDDKLYKEQKEFLTNFEDATHKIAFTIANYKRTEPEQLQPLINLFRRNRFKNINEFVKSLQIKFKDQLDENT